ncbi:oxidoreductase domain-containing protein, partial [mine drainage metagenome]
MGRVHLEALRRVEGVDVVAIAGRELASAQRLGEGYGIEKFESDYRKILSDPSIDAVHICTPNALHYA